MMLEELIYWFASSLAREGRARWTSTNSRFQDTLDNSKAAKDDLKQLKPREAGIYKQAETKNVMAGAQMWKASFIEDKNILLLFSQPDMIHTLETQEYLQLRKIEELYKLRRRLAENEKKGVPRGSHKDEASSRVGYIRGREAKQACEVAQQVREVVRSGSDDKEFEPKLLVLDIRSPIFNRGNLGSSKGLVRQPEGR